MTDLISNLICIPPVEVSNTFVCTCTNECTYTQMPSHTVPISSSWYPNPNYIICLKPWFEITIPKNAFTLGIKLACSNDVLWKCSYWQVWGCKPVILALKDRKIKSLRAACATYWSLSQKNICRRDNVPPYAAFHFVEQTQTEGEWSVSKQLN